MAIQDSLKNALATSVTNISFMQYAPTQYKSKKRQYFKDESRLFVEEMAKYSSDFVEAEVQGLNPAQPFEYTKVHLRFADVVRASASIAYEFDNYKNILVAEKEYTYLRKGAKIKCMGNTWLVINPDNMSNVQARGLVQRCDAVWHYLDYYGNVCTEPFCFDNELLKANTPDAQRAVMITKGYMTAKAQYNEATKQLFENSRLILGSSVYYVTGYSDFIQEFTEDESSINLVEFNCRYEEKNDAKDDMVNKVADGLTFKWEIVLDTDKPTIQVGEDTTIKATSIRTAHENTEVVTSTEEHPINYLWESSDEEIVTVDSYGVLHGVSEGNATITCTLAENPLKKAQMEITVAGDIAAPHVSFTSTVPSALRLYEEVTVTAKYFEEGAEVSGATVTWHLDGANTNSYTASIDGNTVTIKCWGGSVEPLRISAEYNGYGTSDSITLEGI